MHGHLVAVEVCVISGADERMDANCFAFDQLRLKSLDRQSVQSRRAIEQHRMAFRDFVENVPNFRRLAFDHLFRTAHGVHITEVFEPADNEWFEKDQRHLLRQTALMKF